MAKKRKVGNLLALAVLSYLTQGPTHPYDLGRMLRAHGDDRSIRFTHGSLYMVFQQLEKAGFVAPVEIGRAGLRPERTVYALTDAGRRELRDWLRELVAEPEHEYPRFVTALSLIGALPPDEVGSLLTTRLSRLTEVRASTREEIDAALARDVHPLFLIEEEFRLALLDTELRFVTDLLGRIAEWRTAWSAAVSGGGES